MSPIGDGGWRLRYLGPWTWHTHGDRDGWAFPRRRWGWRVVVTARGERLDLHGQTLDGFLDALDAALHFPNLKPVELCDRCLPGLEEGERIPVYLPDQLPCEHTRADACGCGNRPGLHIEGGGMCHLKNTPPPDDCECGNESRPGLHIKGAGARCNPDFYTRSN